MSINGVRNSFIVSEETLKTEQGLQEYEKRLDDPSAKAPEERLFGDKITIKSNDDFNSRFKQLYVWVHPDKHQGHCRELRERLFERVREVAGSYWRMHPSEDPLSGRALKYHEDRLENTVRSDLSWYLGQGRWETALSALRELESKEGSQPENIAPTAAAVRSRLGYLDEAIEKVPTRNDFLKERLKQLKSCIERIQGDGGGSMNEWISQALPEERRMVPHTVYESLAQLSANDPVLHEHYLRLAIRTCPDTFYKQRDLIIKQLKTHLENVYDGAVLAVTLDDLMAIHKKNVSEQWCRFIQKELSPYIRERVEYWGGSDPSKQAKAAPTLWFLGKATSEKIARFYAQFVGIEKWTAAKQCVSFEYQIQMEGEAGKSFEKGIDVFGQSLFQFEELKFLSALEKLIKAVNDPQHQKELFLLYRLLFRIYNRYDIELFFGKTYIDSSLRKKGVYLDGYMVMDGQLETIRKTQELFSKTTFVQEKEASIIPEENLPPRQYEYGQLIGQTTIGLIFFLLLAVIYSQLLQASSQPSLSTDSRARG